MSELSQQISSANVAVPLPRVAFVGVGWIGRNRMEAIARSGAVEISGIMDSDPGNAHAAREIAAKSAIHRSFVDVLASQIDGLVIATPSALHADQAVAALERGIPVFCQKPLGRNAIETQRAIDAARAADRLLAVDLSYRHVIGAQKIRELVRSGELGDIYVIELAFHNAYGPD